VCSCRALLHGVKVANKSAAGFWLWVCDSANGAGVPPANSSSCPQYVAANTGNAFLDWIGAAQLMTAGIYVCASSDPVTLTLIPAADAFFEVAWGELLS
jgi:hypothetical protein